MNKKLIILSVVFVLILITLLIGKSYYIKYKERNIVNVDLCIKEGYPLVRTTPLIQECRTPGGKAFEIHDWNPPVPETDDRIIENYNKGEYGVIVSKNNLYINEENIVIISAFHYKDFNEPVPQSCGERSSTCYILSVNGDKISVILRIYSASGENLNGLYAGDILNKSIGNIPVISFLDKDNVLILSSSGEGHSGILSFIKINIETKKFTKLFGFGWMFEEDMPQLTFSKSGKTLIFKDPTCAYIGSEFRTQCDNKIALYKLNDGVNADNAIFMQSFDGNFKEVVKNISRSMMPIDNIALPQKNTIMDFSFDLKDNIQKDNFEFWIKDKKYIYDFVENKLINQ